MKKIICIFLVFLTVIFAGCSFSQSSDNKFLKQLGIAYTEGDYTLEVATCSGWITGANEELCLSVPISKRILNDQTVSVTSVKNAVLRSANGKIIHKAKTDLTPFIESVKVKNDGVVLFITLKNPGKWKGEDGKAITNNSPVAGLVNLEFTVR